MRNRILFVFIVLFCAISRQGYAQTKVLLDMVDGTEESFTITEAGKIYFANGDLVISEQGESFFQKSTSDIKKIRFSEKSTTSVENSVVKKQAFIVYPNPATDYIYISDNETESIQVLLFTIEGRLLIKKDINTSEPLDISSLTAGIYLIKVNNQTVKLIKQ